MATGARSASARAVADAFAADLATSALASQVNQRAINDRVGKFLAAFDGKTALKPEPLWAHLRPALGDDNAGALMMHLKGLADRHGVALDLPPHLKTLRLAERHALAARFGNKAAPTPTEPAAAVAPEPTDPAGGGTAPRARRVHPLLIAPAVLLIGYLVARPFLGATDEDGPRWRALPVDVPHDGLPCVALRRAGPIAECTVPTSLEGGRDVLGSRAAITRLSLATHGIKTLRVLDADGAMRGVW